MSHSHRDDQDLVGAPIEDAATIVVSPAPPAVTNTEAERRAAERRKAEELPEQITEHQFTADLPEPSRGGTDTETRVRFGDDDAEDSADTVTAAASRRGPPPPRAQQVEDASWAAAPMFDAVGALATTTESWLAPQPLHDGGPLPSGPCWAAR